VITAVAHGHQAAISMDLFCRSLPLTQRPSPFVNLVSQKMGLHEWAYESAVVNDVRNTVAQADLKITLSNRKTEVELGFTKHEGCKEAERCLNCDVQTVFVEDKCIECDACVDICPTTCITFTDNAEEDELRQLLNMPALNKDQDLYVSAPLKTKRVMVKDEDVCLHCGLCAERCPTSAWDMHKFLYKVTKAG
jgi:ferredoxin